MDKLIIDETVYTTQLTKKFATRKKYQAQNPKEVLSYIPGNILSINVKKGQLVKAGEELLILEAMKMKNSIRAPFAGKIKEVYVVNTQMVPKNFLMVEFE
jgi:pyruvate carboxylase